MLMKTLIRRDQIMTAEIQYQAVLLIVDGIIRPIGDNKLLIADHRDLCFLNET